MSGWDRVEVVASVAGVGWAELPWSGWGAAIGWVAGPERTRRCADTRDHVTTVTTYDGDGNAVHASYPVPPEERAEVDDDVDAYLSELGIPPRPRGFRWFVRVPGTPEEFWAAVHAEWHRGGRPTPEWQPLLRDLVGRIR
jgi:hypothetical protein